jgi:hypothetical protein
LLLSRTLPTKTGGQRGIKRCNIGDNDNNARVAQGVARSFFLDIIGGDQDINSLLK